MAVHKAVCACGSSADGRLARAGALTVPSAGCSSEGPRTVWRVRALTPAVAVSNWITLKRHSHGHARKKAGLAFKRLIRMGKSN